MGLRKYMPPSKNLLGTRRAAQVVVASKIREEKLFLRKIKF